MITHPHVIIVSAPVQIIGFWVFVDLLPKLRVRIFGLLGVVASLLKLSQLIYLYNNHFSGTIASSVEVETLSLDLAIS